MNYNFDNPKSRIGTNSVKWGVSPNSLPMWVADMDFETAPCISDVIKEKAALGIYGYELTPNEWYSSYINWWEKYHNLSFSKNNMCFSTGVIPIISSTVRKLTSPGENVVIQTPVYNIFTNSIVNAGRVVLESPLVYDGENYSIDFDDLEKKLSNPQTTLMILCNPHNPIGKIWDSATLAIIGKLCYENNVTVISDEIHCDIAKPGYSYTPFASVNDICKNISVTCLAPTKCFNLAGIQSACCVVFNEGLKNKVFKALNSDEVAEGNTFSYVSAIAAFNEGKPWLDEMNIYVQNNKDYVENYFKVNNLPIRVVPSNCTYLLWLDCSAITNDTKDLVKILDKEYKVLLTHGSVYGENGKPFIRMNVATSKSLLIEGLNRIKQGIIDYINK